MLAVLKVGRIEYDDNKKAWSFKWDSRMYVNPLMVQTVIDEDHADDSEEPYCTVQVNGHRYSVAGTGAQVAKQLLEAASWPDELEET